MVLFIYFAIEVVWVIHMIFLRLNIAEPVIILVEDTKNDELRCERY